MLNLEKKIKVGFKKHDIFKKWSSRNTDIYSFIWFYTLSGFTVWDCQESLPLRGLTWQKGTAVCRAVPSGGGGRGWIGVTAQAPHFGGPIESGGAAASSHSLPTFPRHRSHRYRWLWQLFRIRSTQDWGGGRTSHELICSGPEPYTLLGSALAAWKHSFL